MIDLTPLEVRKKKGDFRRVMRGYEPALVDDFLDIVADRLEQLVREHAALSERVGGLDRQVSEYRERERALTDALVTAQAMKEEMRSRTTQEVDELKQRAMTDADTRLQQARQEADTLLQRAREEAAAQLRRAEQEAQAQLQHAEEEAATLRETASAMRQREEELLDELRSRQQQLLGSYRSFLERELSELKVMVESIETAEVPVSARGRAEHAPARAERARPAAGAEKSEAKSGRTERSAKAIEKPVDKSAEASAAVEAPPVVAEPDTGLDAVIADATDGLARVAAANEGLERFAPEEPHADQPLEVPELPLLEEPQPAAPAKRSDLPLLEDEPPARGKHLASDALAEERTMADADAGDDDEAARLLENAERAGYRINLLDDAEPASGELLLEDTAADDESDDDWLSSMIGEEEK